MLPDASSRKPLLSNKQFFPPFSLNKMREPNGKFMFLFWAPKLSWMFLPIFFFFPVLHTFPSMKLLNFDSPLV